MRALLLPYPRVHLSQLVLISILTSLKQQHDPRILAREILSASRVAVDRHIEFRFERCCPRPVSALCP
ncbi:unnamed protein product [Amoebophrya sp. A25]|nr:unnamed protein product [Amoebophrya sp. A25]|eukprot:GSA25T00026424001.1